MKIGFKDEMCKDQPFNITIQNALHYYCGLNVNS